MSEGLYNKYKVINQETGEEVTDCFVLRPKSDPAAIRALECYIQECRDYKLADDLTFWLASPELNPELTQEDIAQIFGECIFTTHQGYVMCYGIDPNKGSTFGPRIDCGSGRGLSLFGFGEDWKAYRRRPSYLFARAEKVDIELEVADES